MSWRTLYTQYDDDTLIVFANAGLLRRARKDLDKVILTDAASGSFGCDGQNVILSPEGIQKASCDCSAPGCCKHILAAVLWLQANTFPAPLANEHVGDEPSSGPLLPDLLALDAAQLIKKSNKADCRLALKWWQQWQPATLPIEDNGTQLKISLPDFDEPIIFMRASGYEGMLSSLPEQQKKAIHLAAIAKIFAQHGQPWPWPEDLIETGRPRPLSDDEIALIDTVKAFIHSLLQQGLSHVSKSSATQLHLLNMSARAEGLPRLAAWLRGLSGQVALLAKKHFTLDESQVLRYLAQLSAYLYQLTHAPIADLPQVRGQLRRQYNEKDDVLSLLPIGANWWVADSGALGATFTFWDSDNQQLLQSTQARANRFDTQFHRQNVWSSLAFWKHTASHMMRRPLQLHHPRLSDEGKLAAGGETYAATAPSLLSIDALQTLKTQFGSDNWQTLEHDLAQQSEDFFTPYVLYPAEYQSLTWYETEQCVVWQLNDSADNAAFLRLYWGKAEQSSFEELRYITEKRLTVLAVSVQPVRKEQGIDLIPTTLWLKNGDHVELFYLDFDHYPRKKKPSTFISRIQEYMAQKKQHSTMLADTTPTLAQQLSCPLLSVLEAQACTGRYGLSPQQKTALAQCLQTANDLGMAFMAQQLRQYLAQPLSQTADLLRLVWLCDRLQQLQSPLPIRLAEAKAK